MKHIKIFSTILVISISLALIGLWIDSDPSNPNVMTTVFELAMMTLLLFAILTTLYFTTSYTLKKVKQ
jgi:heme A synthase